MDSAILGKRRQQVLYDEKWKKFLRRTWLFRYLPFVDVAFAAGSMVTGNVNENSDFDVIVGVREGRIFSARFFSVIAFGLFGWRRSKIDHREAAKDKVCLNHFVTPSAFRLSAPYEPYWHHLYRMLVPLFGDMETVRSFWISNEAWMEKKVMYEDDLRHRHRKSSTWKILIEKILGGSVGDSLERILRNWQIRRIEEGLRRSGELHKPRIRFDDHELEFHPDTRRIQLFQK